MVLSRFAIPSCVAMVLVAKRRHWIAWGEVSEGERNPRIDSTIRRVAKRRHVLRSLIQNAANGDAHGLSYSNVCRRVATHNSRGTRYHGLRWLSPPYPWLSNAVASRLRAMVWSRFAIPSCVAMVLVAKRRHWIGRRFATPSHGFVAVRYSELCRNGFSRKATALDSLG